MLDTRLVKAAESGDTEQVLSLIGQIPEKYHPEQLYLALLWAATGNQIDTMQALLRLEADVNASYYRGHRILSEAAKAGSADAVRLLIAVGADPSAHDPWGKTALDYAQRYKRSEVIMELMSALKRS